MEDMEDKRCYTPLQKGLPPIENRIYTTRYEYSTPLDIYILYIFYRFLGSLTGTPTPSKSQVAPFGHAKQS